MSTIPTTHCLSQQLCYATMTGVKRLTLSGHLAHLVPQIWSSTSPALSLTSLTLIDTDPIEKKNEHSQTKKETDVELPTLADSCSNYLSFLIPLCTNLKHLALHTGAEMPECLPFVPSWVEHLTIGIGHAPCCDNVGTTTNIRKALRGVALRCQNLRHLEVPDFVTTDKDHYLHLAVRVFHDECSRLDVLCSISL